MLNTDKLQAAASMGATAEIDGLCRPVEYLYNAVRPELLEASLEDAGGKGWFLVSATPVINSMGNMNVMVWHLIFMRHQHDENKTESEPTNGTDNTRND